MRDRRTTGFRRALVEPLDFAALAGRIVAQVIVVGLWWGGRASQGVNASGDSDFLGSLLFAAIPTVPFALTIGLLGGIGRALDTRWRVATVLRVLAPILLVLLALVWITPVGGIATITGEDPALPTYLGALAGMECALAAEWLASMAVRFFAWRRGRR